MSNIIRLDIFRLADMQVYEYLTLCIQHLVLDFKLLGEMQEYKYLNLCIQCLFLVFELLSFEGWECLILQYIHNYRYNARLSIHDVKK